jgi:hypothetical protein
MKMRNLIVLTILIVVTACEGEVPVLKQKILFQRHYVNYAWFYTDNGYLVDSMGYVRSFDVAKKKLKWNYPDSLGYISKEAMDQNLSYCDSIIHRVGADSLSHYVDKIWGASRGMISKPDMQMADFGEIRYSAYIFDEKKQRYKEVLIKLYGDIMSNNSSPEAQEIYGWMNRIGQK